MSYKNKKSSIYMTNFMYLKINKQKVRTKIYFKIT